MNHVDLSKLSVEELQAELEKRKGAREKTSQNQLNTISMEEAFKLAKEYELDSMYSIKFGYPNIYTNWVRFIEDNNLDMKPFTTWYDDDGNKIRKRPQQDSEGFYPGYAKIVLYYDGEVIQKVCSSDGGQLFPVLYEHCQ